MRNFALSAARTVLQMANNFSWVALAPLVGAEFLGYAVFALSVSAMATWGTGFGCETAALYVPKNARRVATTLLVLRSVLTGPAAILTFGVTAYANSNAPPYFPLVAAMLPLTGVASLLEARASRVSGPDRVLNISLYSLPFVILARCVLTYSTENVALALVPNVFYEACRIAFLYKLGGFTRIQAPRARRALRLLSTCFPFYKVNLLNVVVLRLIPTYATFALGPSSAGVIAIHLAPVDAFGQFCSTYSQIIYARGSIKPNRQGLEHALKPLAICSWIGVMCALVAAYMLPSKIVIAAISFQPLLFALCTFTTFTFSFGAIFSHWAVARGERSLLPKYHLYSLSFLILALLALNPLGILGIILARPLASFSGHAAMAARMTTQKTQWSVFWRSAIWPFGLGKYSGH
jgi:hypothetical protein